MDFVYIRVYAFIFPTLKILWLFVHGGAQEKDRCGTEGYGSVGMVWMSSDGCPDLMAGSPAHDTGVETR